MNLGTGRGYEPPMTRPLAIALALAASAFASPAPAQGTTVDEGTFVVTRNGVVVGKEAFRILRSSSGGRRDRARPRPP